MYIFLSFAKGIKGSEANKERSLQVSRFNKLKAES